MLCTCAPSCRDSALNKWLGVSDLEIIHPAQILQIYWQLTWADLKCESLGRSFSESIPTMANDFYSPATKARVIPGAARVLPFRHLQRKNLADDPSRLSFPATLFMSLTVVSRCLVKTLSERVHWKTQSTSLGTGLYVCLQSLTAQMAIRGWSFLGPLKILLWSSAKLFSHKRLKEDPGLSLQTG